MEAQKHFKTSRNNASGKATATYLLSGKCICGYCGAVISAESGTGKKGKTYRYYKCGNKKRGSKCELSPVRQDVLETAVIEATKRDMLTDETITELVKRIMILQDEEEASDYSAILKSRLEDAEKRRKNLLRLVEASGDMDLDGVPERLAEISQEIKDLKGEIIKEELSKVRYSEKVIRLWLETFRDADFGNEKTRKQFVETFIDHIELKNGEALIFYNMQEKSRNRKCSNTAHLVDLTIRYSNPVPFEDYIIMLIKIPA